MHYHKNQNHVTADSNRVTVTKYYYLSSDFEPGIWSLSSGELLNNLNNNPYVEMALT